MTQLRSLLASLAVLAAFALVPATTQAFDGYGGPLCNTTAFGVSGSVYGLGIIPAPPYFAVHPPVYYGQRYFRTYGESPYARPARSSRNFNVAVQIVKNPFVMDLPMALPSEPAEVDVPDEAQESADEEQVVVQPQMIINPYYTESSEIAQN